MKTDDEFRQLRVIHKRDYVHKYINFQRAGLCAQIHRLPECSRVQGLLKSTAVVIPKEDIKRFGC